MYLSRRLYVKRWEHKGADNFSVSVKKGGKEYPGVDPEKISHITEETMYWRKANHIHKWFVDNVQDGVDDCKECYVEVVKLAELRDLCKEVMDKAVMVPGQVHVGTTWSGGTVTENYEDGSVISNAEEIADLLPTESGFFFGCTDYNEWYLGDVKKTYEVLSSLDLESYDWEYYYQSSW